MGEFKEQRQRERAYFNEALARRMQKARKAAKLTQEALSESCGYSVQMIRRFESDTERNAPIPAFVLYQYALYCGRTMEELCSDYVDESASFFNRRDKREADILKVLTEDEKKIISDLRRWGVELDVSIAPFLAEMNKEDYLLLHCLLELKKQRPTISKSIREFIRSLYINVITKDDSYLRQFIINNEEWDL